MAVVSRSYISIRKDRKAGERGQLYVSNTIATKRLVGIYEVKGHYIVEQF
jgi:hypothetical protein